jgi:NAD(P)-dependent dehydrogenase (short-subunit alcohol dehydrogenase family)
MTVNAVCPAFVDTPMADQRRARSLGQRPSEDSARRARKHERQRAAGHPDGVAADI